MTQVKICRECDTAYSTVVIQRGDIARCRCCGKVLARLPRPDVDKALAIALASGILLLIANLTPMLGIEVAGTRTEANIWQAAVSLESGWISVSALLLILTMLFGPLLQVLLVLWLMTHARLGRRAPGFVQALVVLHVLRPWSMSEVFLLGALVAIVKLSHFLPISTGPGVWALGLLTALLAVLSRFDSGSWWELEHRGT